MEGQQGRGHPGGSADGGPGADKPPEPIVPASARPLPGVNFPIEQTQSPPAPPGGEPSDTGPVSPTRGGPALPGRRRLPWRAALILLVVAAFGVVGFVVSRGDDERSEIEAMGGEVGHALSVLGEAEAAVGDVAVAENAAVARDLKCWFSYPTSGAKEPNDFLRCGPILFVDSDPDEFWIVVPVSFSAGEDGTVATVEPDIEQRTSKLDPDEELARPDGGSPPGPDDVDIEPPPPPSAEEGLTQVTEGSPPIDLDEEPEDGRLNGKSYRLDVDGFSYTDRVAVPVEGGLFDTGDSGGDVFAPASGEQFLVAQLTVDSFSVWDQPPAEFALVVDGRRRDLGELADPYNEDTRTWTLIASVPTDAEDVALVGSEVELEQTWSFVDQQRSDDAPDVLYRDEQSLSTDVNQQFSLSFAVDAVEDYNDSPFGDQQVSLSIGNVELHYVVEDENGRVHTASAPDRALLYLTDVEVSSPLNNASYGAVGFAASLGNMVLVLPDGTQVSATRLSDSSTAILGGMVAWDVPANIQTATITITPGRGPNSDNPSEVVDFQDSKASFDINFGPP
jgi:hypothetical protein